MVHLRLIGSSFVAALMLASGYAQAQSWTLTTGDLASRDEMTLKSLSTGGATLTSRSGETVEVPSQRLLELRNLAARVSRGDGTLSLATRAGDVFPGTPVTSDDDSIEWKSPSLGTITVPLASIKAVYRGDAPAEAAAGEDVVRLSNGDVIRGVFLGTSDAEIAVQVGDDPLTVPIASVKSMQLAEVAAAEPAGGPGYRLSLTDGTVFAVESVSFDGTTWSFTRVGGEAQRLASSRVAGLVQVNGPVVWVSQLTPTETIQKPFLTAGFPTRFESDVFGRPIKAGGRTIAHGIGVHAYSKITFDLPEGYDIFRTQYALAEPGEYGAVEVRVLLDGKPVYSEQKSGAGVSKVVAIPLNGARTLTLEVDYGAGYDTQDAFTWIEPALVRE